MKFSLCAVVLLLSFAAAAQFPVPKFGVIDKSDLEMKSCAFDKEADAMKLLDITETELQVFESAKMTTERRVRIKIFNESGFRHTIIKIPYVGQKKSTRIKGFTAIVYNLNAAGKIVTQKLEKDDVFKETVVGNVRYMTFTFPNVKKGSVVEYRYTKIQKNDIGIDAWVVQDVIPTAYAAAVVTIPETGHLFSRTLGFDSIAYSDDVLNPLSNYPRLRRIYQKKHIPAFHAEPFMSSSRDNQLKIVFEIRPRTFIVKESNLAWRIIGNALLRSSFLGAHIRSTIPGTEPIIDSAKKISNITERIGYLFERVKQQLPEVDGQTFVSDDLAAAWTERTGSTADLNLTLLNLLRKSGVQCHPILVSTRNNGMVAMEFPSLSQINGVNLIAYDSAKGYIIDASQKHSFRIPPYNILNRNIYLLDSSEMKWIYLEDARILNMVQTKVVAELTEGGMAKGTMTIKRLDYAKEEPLDSIEAVEKEKAGFASRPIGLTIHSSQVDFGSSSQDPSVRTIHFDLEPGNDGTFYYVNPKFAFGMEQNPFVSKDRRTDVDFGSNTRISMDMTINVSKAFSIEHIPQNIRLRSSDTTMSYTRMIFQDDGVIVYRQEFEIRRPFFYKEEYATVHQFFEKMYTYLKEEIILKRK